MEDGQIIQLFLERNENAVEEVNKAYGSRLFCLAMSIMGSREDADECVNDTLWKVWRAIPPANPDSLFAFMAKICRNTALDKLSYQNAKKRQGILLELTAEMERCIPDKSGEYKAKGRELSALLDRFLGGLTKEKRMIFMRRYWYGDSVAQIAVRYGIGESKVKTTLFRTRKELKKYLEREDYHL